MRGRAEQLPQSELFELVAALFRCRDRRRPRIAGRGADRRLLRQLLARWQETAEPLALERAVAELLEASSLWQPVRRVARRALVGELRYAER